MSNITFDNDAKSVLEKENIEWIRIWCEDTNNAELPRVALVGDSITEGYYNLVKEALKDIARVDYLATSYSIASDIYHQSVKNFIKDSDYKVVHFNYGLHAYSVSEEVYAERCKELLQLISKRAETIVATTTIVVLSEEKNQVNPRWKNKVISRNQKIAEIAKELKFNINDLYSASGKIDASMRVDECHFTKEGYEVLANSVVSSIKEIL